MPKRQIFYSFHFDNDVMRVQQVRQMGVIEGNVAVAPNTWEEVKRKGRTSIENWIDENMRYRSCVVVLIGTKTHQREWVRYEIDKAWRDGKGLMGIHIHNLNCPNTGTCAKGANPFDDFTFRQGGRILTPVTYDPPANAAYQHIHANLADWVEQAIRQRS